MTSTPPQERRSTPASAARSRRRTQLILLAIFAVLLCLERPGSWLIDPDESRYAEIPREMLASRDFITPTLNGSHYFEKPPLHYWLTAAAIATLGTSPAAVRLPVRLAAFATMALVASAFTTASAPGAGLWAALFFISAPLGFALGRFNVIDGVLCTTLTLAFAGLRGFFMERERGGRALRQQIVLGIGLGLAVLAKGLVGIVLPAGVALLWCALLGRWRLLRDVLVSWTPLVCLAIATPWFVLVSRANPGFASFFFIHEHFLRYASPISSRPGPPYYFVGVFLAGFLPWIGLLGAGSRPLWTRRRAVLEAHADDLFLALWFAVILVFFSTSRSKLIPYILPALPAAALLAARALVRRSGRPLARLLLPPALILIPALPAGLYLGLQGSEYANLGFMAALVAAAAWIAVRVSKRPGMKGVAVAAAGWAAFYLALVISLPRFAERYSSYSLAVTAKKTGVEDVVAYRCYPQSFPWVLERTVPVVEYRDELASDGQMSPELFWSPEHFWRRWNSEEHLVVVARDNDDLIDFFRHGPRHLNILERPSGRILIANFPPAPPPGGGPWRSP